AAVLVWELESGRSLFQSVPRRLAEQAGFPVFSADNRYVAFTDLDASNAVAIVELSTARVVQRLPQLATYSSFRFQPGAAVLTVSAGPEVQSWNCQTGEKIDTLPHPTRVRGFAWNWDGTKLAAGCDDAEVYLCDVPRHESQVS